MPRIATASTFVLPALPLALAARAAAAQPAPRVSVDLAVLGTQLPAPLRSGDACGEGGRTGVGASLGIGYRLRPRLRAEARLGGFEQPGAFVGADCVTGPASAPRFPPAPGTVERFVGFDPLLADRRAFTQGRLVADFAPRAEALRLTVGAGTLLRIRAPFVSAGGGFGGRLGGALVLLEAEQWWMRAPSVDRTTTWQALPTPPGAPAGYTPTTPVVTAERRSSRGVRATWLRLSATLPLPGT